MATRGVSYRTKYRGIHLTGLNVNDPARDLFLGTTKRIMKVWDGSAWKTLLLVGDAVEAQVASQVPLTIKGATNQTANLTEWRSSDGTLLAKVDKDGKADFAALTVAGGSVGGGHTVMDEGVALSQRTRLDFVGAGVTVTDSQGSDKTVVTIPGGGHTILDEGVTLTNRANLDFQGYGVTVTDDVANGKTVVTIPAGPVATQTIYTKVLLADTTLGVAAAEFDFTNLDQSYDHLEILATLRTSRNAIDDSVYMFFNGDTTATNYRSPTTYYGFVGSPYHSVSDSPSIAQATGATALAGEFSVAQVQIPFYRQGDITRQWHWKSSDRRNATDQNGLTWEGSGAWEGRTDAINRITIKSGNSANFVASSRVQIFGLKSVTVASAQASQPGVAIQAKKLLYDSGVIGADVASFDVQGLAQDCDHLEWVISARTSDNSSQAIYLRLNGDNVAGNYTWARQYGGSGNGGDQIDSVMNAVGQGSAATYFGRSEGKLFHYTNGSAYKNMTFTTPIYDAGGNYDIRSAGIWKNAAAVNRMTFTPASGNIKAGSRLQIYGIGQVTVATNGGPVAPASLFRATNSGNTTLTGDYNPHKVEVSTEVTDLRGDYDAANSRWIPPAGWVCLIGNIKFADNTSYYWSEIDILKNGVSIAKQASRDQSSYWDQIAITTLDYANGSDYYELAGGTGASGTTNRDVAAAQFQGYVINGGIPNTAKFLLAQADTNLPNAITIPSLASSPERYPASPKTEDEEFDSVALPAKWSITTNNAAAYDVNTTWPSWLYVRFSGNQGFEIDQAFAPAGDFSLTLRGSFAVSGQWQGIHILAGSTNWADAVRGSFEWSGSPGAPGIFLSTCDSSTWNYNRLSRTSVALVSQVYLHLQRVSNAWSVWCSSDGYSFACAGGTYSKTFTVGKIRIALNQNGVTTPAQCGIDWIRRDWRTF